MLKDHLTKGDLTSNQVAVRAIDLISKLMVAKDKEELKKTYIEETTGILLSRPLDVTPETLFGRK
jgi:hypothetical protein